MGGMFGFMTQESKSTNTNLYETDNSNLASAAGNVARYETEGGDVSILDEGAITAAFQFARSVSEMGNATINTAMENVASVAQKSGDKVETAYATSQGKSAPVDQNMLVIVSGLVLAIIAYKAVG